MSFITRTEKSFSKTKKYIEGFNLNAIKKRKNFLANILPYSCVIQDNVVLLKNGALMKCYSYSCPDLGFRSEASINSIANYFNRAVKLLGTSWSVQFEVQRVMTQEYPDTVWTNEAAT